ncbi:hypothetical protein CC78DRAFT_617641 [Lojkania enalia]|uniref:Uncharacterized protein n=1 Tax=Lojkania enalia TaxID=147567 RepID=A0A9P4KBC3_9PLEO|nr:hypothetical protein CC78DRAFT_617641 [Didymosphaeria enalia]
MCVIHSVKYECGHTLHTFIEHCSSVSWQKDANAFRHIPRNRIPGYCLGKLEFAHGPDQPALFCSDICPQAQAFEATRTHFKTINAEIQALDIRLEVIHACVARIAHSPSTAPKYDFRHLRKLGWDPELLKEMCEAALASLHPLLNTWNEKREAAIADVYNACRTQESCIRTFSVTAINSSHVTRDLVNVDIRSMAELGESWVAQLYELVAEIERRASEACLEKLGWKLPEENNEQCQRLREWTKWKEGIVSGSRMDGAFCVVNDMDTAE